MQATFSFFVGLSSGADSLSGNPIKFIGQDLQETCNFISSWCQKSEVLGAKLKRLVFLVLVLSGGINSLSGKQNRLSDSCAFWS